MVKKITFRIAKDGSTHLQVEGVSGPSCKTLTEGFERALGKIVRSERTDAYWSEEMQCEENSQS
jgi:hypothetical protein